MSSSFRIVFICSEYPPAKGGGIGVFVKMIAQGLVREGCLVTVIGFDEVNRDVIEDDGGVSVIRLRNPFKDAAQLRVGKYFLGMNSIKTRRYLSVRLEKLICEFQPILVESYDWSGPLWSKPSVPLVLRMHGAHTAYNYFEKKRTSRLLKFYELRNLKMADFYCAVSQHIGEVTLEAFGLKRPFAVLYNFVDLSVFRSAVDFGDREPVILFVGRVEPRKGVSELFYALKTFFQLNREGRCELAGPVGESFQEELLAILPSEYRDRVKFLGKIPHADLPAVYSRARLFVMPSRAEAFGLTAVEAMGCETPVVLTNKASSPELVEDGISGFLVDFTSPERVAARFDELMSDVAELRRVGERGRMRAMQMFSKEAMIRRNIEFYGCVADKF